MTGRISNWAAYLVPVALTAMCLAGCGGDGDGLDELDGLARPSAATYDAADRAMAGVDGRIKNVIPLDVLGQYVCAALRKNFSAKKTNRIVRDQIDRSQEGKPETIIVTDELAEAIVSVYRGPYCTEWAAAASKIK